MKSVKLLLTIFILSIVSVSYSQSTKVDIKIQNSKVALFEAYCDQSDSTLVWTQTEEPIYHQRKSKGKFKALVDTTLFIIIETYEFQKENGENYRYMIQMNPDSVDNKTVKVFNLEIYDGYILWGDSTKQYSFSENNIPIHTLD